MGSLLCVRHYTRYIIIVAHGKSCVHAYIPGDLPAWPSSSLRGSSHPPPFPPPLSLSLSLAVSLYYSRYPLLLVPRPASYRESFRVRLRATDYRNQAISGSGISTANYNHRFFLRTSLPCFHARFVAAPRMYEPTDPGETAGKPVIRASL